VPYLLLCVAFLEYDRPIISILDGTPGIHNVGSYGTRAVVKAGDGYATGRLGFVVDYNRTGWAKGYAGDFFIPLSPIERKLILLALIKLYCV
jgi:hypothetical protein